MSTLCLQNAIGKLYPDFRRAGLLESPVSRLRGFASFVQPGPSNRNVRLNVLAWIPAGKLEYQLSLDGGFTGSMAPNPNKFSELDPDYKGAIGSCRELQVEGWKRADYIWLRIHADIATYRREHAKLAANFFRRYSPNRGPHAMREALFFLIQNPTKGAQVPQSRRHDPQVRVIDPDGWDRALTSWPSFGLLGFMAGGATSAAQTRKRPLWF